MGDPEEFLVKTQNLGVKQYRPVHSENLSKWMPENKFELFMTSASLKFPVTTQLFEDYRQSRELPNTHEFLAVYHIASGEHIGHFELKNISLNHEHGTLAHVLLGDKKFRETGYGKELCQLMADYGFNIKKLHRLSASVQLCNIAAITVYVKGGFVMEGIIRDVLKFDGKRYSLYQMSLLRSDWRSTTREKLDP